MPFPSKPKMRTRSVFSRAALVLALLSTGHVARADGIVPPPAELPARS